MICDECHEAHDELISLPDGRGICTGCLFEIQTKQGPGKCPCCGEETNLSYATLDMEGDLIIQEAWCLKCRCDWHDVYAFSESIVDQEGKIKIEIHGKTQRRDV